MADSTHGPNLQNLRRFSLVIGLSLITFSLAGIEIQADEVLRPLGFPLKISEPALVRTVLVIASVYAIIRFSFYGIFIAGTPRRRRKELWGRMGRPNPDVDAIAEIRSLYPIVFGKTPNFDSRQGGNDIPLVCKIGAFLQSVDYTAPVWVNVIALFLTYRT